MFFSVSVNMMFKLLPPIDEDLRQERPIYYGVNDQRVGPGVKLGRNAPSTMGLTTRE
jgi:hypothetical protein